MNKFISLLVECCILFLVFYLYECFGVELLLLEKGLICLCVEYVLFVNWLIFIEVLMLVYLEILVFLVFFF